MKLYNFVKDRKYILTHQKSIYLNKELDINKDFSNLLIIDINKNLYSKGDENYEICQKFINLPLLYYKDLIENADELHLIDSSLYCFSNILNLDKVKIKKVYFDKFI